MTARHSPWLEENLILVSRLMRPRGTSRLGLGDWRVSRACICSAVVDCTLRITALSIPLALAFAGFSPSNVWFNSTALSTLWMSHWNSSSSSSLSEMYVAVLTSTSYCARNIDSRWLLMHPHCFYSPFHKVATSTISSISIQYSMQPNGWIGIDDKRWLKWMLVQVQTFSVPGTIS